MMAAPAFSWVGVNSVSHSSSITSSILGFNGFRAENPNFSSSKRRGGFHLIHWRRRNLPISNVASDQQQRVKDYSSDNEGLNFLFSFFGFNSEFKSLSSFKKFYFSYFSCL